MEHILSDTIKLKAFNLVNTPVKAKYSRKKPYMSSKPSIAYINIRVFAYATEDPEKVQTAIRNILPQEMADILVFEKSNLAGHYGNSIVLFTATLTDKKLLPNALEKIGAGLSSLDKEAFCTDFKLHVEKSNLYLRFDKQSAYLGNIKFTQNDPIHFKIHFKHKSAAEIESLCRTAGLLP